MKSSDFVRGNDGFYIYWPTDKGAYTAHCLRRIANQLDSLNEDLEKELLQELGKTLSTLYCEHDWIRTSHGSKIRMCLKCRREETVEDKPHDWSEK